MAEQKKFNQEDYEEYKRMAEAIDAQYYKSHTEMMDAMLKNDKKAFSELASIRKKFNEDEKKSLKEIETLAGKSASAMTAAFTKSTSSIGSQFSKLGATIKIDSSKIRGAMSDAFKGGATGVGALKAGTKKFTQELNTGLGSANNQIGMLIKGGEQLLAIFKKMDTSTSNLARSMNLTYDQAWKVRTALRDSSIASGEMAATGESLSKSMIEMNSQLGTAARFDNERLITYTKLRDVAKFEAEVLEDINRISLASKQTQLDVTKNRLAQINLSKIQLGRQIDERKVMQDIAKASYNVKINYLGRDKDLAKAATQARALGMELSQTERIAENLLDFENSIKNQMEAELLTGRTLNLERARYFALTNDLVGLQTELNRQGVTAEKFGKMNRIQQNAIAGAMGMSKDEMSKMLVEQKALQNLGVGSLEAAQKEYELAVKNGTVDKFEKKLGDESLIRQFKQQSLQERMTMAVEKMLSVFEKLAVVFKPFYEMFVGFVELLGKSETLLKSIAVIVGMIAAKKIGNIAGGLFSGGARTGMSVSGLASSGAGAGATGATLTAAGGLAGAGGSTVASQAMAGGKRARTVNRMKNAGKATTSPITPLTPSQTKLQPFTPPTGLTTPKPTSFVDKIKNFGSELNPMNALKNAFKGMSAKSFFKSAGKMGVVASLFEGFFANQDIKTMISSGASKDELNKMVGARVAQSIGSIIGGAGLGALLSPIPGGAIIGGMLGSYGGSAFADFLVGKFGAAGLGEAVLDTFYKGKMKESDVPGLATGGVVEKTGLIKAHAGEVYTGGGTLKMFEGMWQEMKNQNQQLKEQNRYLAAIANKSTVLQLDRQVLATEMGKEVAMSYGNILNPGSQTFS